MKVNLTKTYEVEFAKDGASYKKGDKVSVNMLLAAKFFQDGRVATVPTELIEDAKKIGAEDLFNDGRVATVPTELIEDAKKIGAEDLFNKKKNLKDIV